jgi:hypothetical protein
MAALRNASKCSHTKYMLRFFTISRLALNHNLIFEIGSNNQLPAILKNLIPLPEVIPDSPSETTCHDNSHILLTSMRAVQVSYSSTNI